MGRRGHGRGVWWAGAALFAVFAAFGPAEPKAQSPSAAGSSLASEAEVFDKLAGELIEGLKASAGAIPSFFRVGRRKIAIWPFSQHDVPVSTSLAERFNDSLLNALVQKAGGRYDIIDRSAFGKLIKELEEWGPGVKDPVNVVAEKAAADILVVGRIGLVEGQATIFYRALRASGDGIGNALAATKEHNVEIAGKGPALSIAQAAAQAAKRFSGHVNNMSELELRGVRFEDTKFVTSFGRRLEERLAGGITTLVENAITDRKLKVTSADTASATAGGRPGVYILSGSYWDLGDVVDARLTLADPQGRTVVWGDLVRPDDAEVRPPGNFPSDLLRQGGTIKITLSSDRGDKPSYRIGEKLNLVIEMDRDAWLYCFYRQTDRKWVKLFPNVYHKDNSLPGRKRHKIPGEILPFDLKVDGPPGIDLVKCFATTRNVAADLPAAVGKPDAPPLEPGWDFRLPRVFRSLANAGESEASLVVTVEQ